MSDRAYHRMAGRSAVRSSARNSIGHGSHRIGTFPGWRFLEIIVVTLGLVFGLPACRESAAPRQVQSPKGLTNVQTFQVRGVVREVFPEEKKVKIAHETITNYMEAMTMMFDVKDGKELSGIVRNDRVTFRMVVTEDDGWIENLKRTGSDSTVTALASPDGFRRVREVEPLNVGDFLPKYPLTNELGRLVNLEDYRGQVIAFTFIFTRCPFPTFCPRLSTTLGEAQQLLKAKDPAPFKWHLLSISIDPEFDTAAMLKAYAQNHQADPERWSFLTGELIEITALGEQFGLQFWKSANGSIEHNVRTVVVDTEGRIRWITKDNNFPAALLVEEMVKASQKFVAPIEKP